MAEMNAYKNRSITGSPEFWPSVAEYLVLDEFLYFAMKSDQRRIDAYRSALKQHAQDKIVVDIGTGPEALLAAMAIECGARHVYAIEYLDMPYKKALASVRSRGLADRITLIHGDARNIQLPERGDVCVSALVGSIGSLEGVVPILSAARIKLLKPDAFMIPKRSVTHIAAVSLPEELRSKEGFSELPARYVDKVFASVGYEFDLRLCVRNFPKDLVRTTVGTFEDLDFAGTSGPSYLSSDINLEVQRDARVDGFLLWLNLHLIQGVEIDILKEDHCLLPIYFDVFENGVELEAGDRVVATCTTSPSINGVNPDYHIEGTIVRATGSMPFAVDSIHCPRSYKSRPLFRRLFSGSDGRRGQRAIRVTS